MDLKSSVHIDEALLAAANQHLADCRLCPFDCGTLRATAEGVCRVGQQSFIASEMLHMGEESLLAPAHAIFLSGCTARCTFCTAAKFAFVPTYGVTVTPDQLATRMDQRQAEGARTICFIGGDPAPHIPFILAALAALGVRKRVPIVFNSNFYLSDAALKLLEPAIDIYLPDLKFGPPKGGQDCGNDLGSMPDYWSTVTSAIDRVHRHRMDQGCGQVIVRHLLMPGHFECCTLPILAWLAERPGLQLSLLTQYIAPGHAKGELAGSVSSSDVDRAREMAARLGLSLVA